MDVLVVNGPNLNLLGRRDPQVYGRITADELDSQVRDWGAEVGLEVGTFQSNHEGALVDRIHDLVDSDTDLVLNAGALTHYSYVLRDALDAVATPTVEVHISNIYHRETWRRRSVIHDVCDTSIVGRGVIGYRWALHFLHWRRSSPAKVESYGPEPRQRVSIRDGSGPPLAIVHTGIDDPTAGWDQVESIATALAARGHTVVSIEYRPGHADGDLMSALVHTGHQGRVILDGDTASLASGLDHEFLLLDPSEHPGNSGVIVSDGSIESRSFTDRAWLERLQKL